MVLGRSACMGPFILVVILELDGPSLLPKVKVQVDSETAGGRGPASSALAGKPVNSQAPVPAFHTRMVRSLEPVFQTVGSETRRANTACLKINAIHVTPLV